MNAEFNWWLLILGLVLGAALTWLVMAESARRDIDITEEEARGESHWIATVMSGAGTPIAPDRVEDVLRLHREYLAAPPPDDPITQDARPQSEPAVPSAAPGPLDRSDAVVPPPPPEARLEQDR
jgi:hypothetical protein